MLKFPRFLWYPKMIPPPFSPVRECNSWFPTYWAKYIRLEHDSTTFNRAFEHKISMKWAIIDMTLFLK